MNKDRIKSHIRQLKYDLEDEQDKKEIKKLKTHLRYWNNKLKEV